MEKALLKYIDVDILPNQDDIDVTDMVFIITYQFTNINTESQYESKIKEMIQSNDLVLSSEKMLHIIPLISNFVQWLKQV